MPELGSGVRAPTSSSTCAAPASARSPRARGQCGSARRRRTRISSAPHSSASACRSCTRWPRGITGGWAIRGQGTIGGSLVAARRQSDVPAVLVALGARGPRRERGRRARACPWPGCSPGRCGPACARGELLTALELPVQTGTHGYVKLKRGASSWPIATAAAVGAGRRRHAARARRRRGNAGRGRVGGRHDDGDRRPVGRRARARRPTGPRWRRRSRRAGTAPRRSEDEMELR